MNSTADISRNSASNNTAPGHHLANNHDEHNVYDVAVIGAGPAGENVAQYASQGSGLSAVLIEGGLVGGDCSYYACMPSKALLRPLEVAGASAHLTGLEAARVSAPGLLERRDKWVSHYDDAGQVFWAASTGIDVMRGWARLDGERRVVVSTPEGVRLLEARRAVVLANGSQPVIPAELQDVQPWGSRAAGWPPEPIPTDIPVPQVVFTDPQVASSGLTQAQARDAGMNIVTARVAYTSAAGAALMRDDANGEAGLVVDRASRTVVGATFVGPEAGELIHAATIAITAKVPIPLLRHAIPAYPTASEIWLRLIESLPTDMLHPGQEIR